MMDRIDETDPFKVVAMIPTFETPRLILRPTRLEDADATQALFPHWEIVRFLSDRVPWPYPADGAHTYYRDVALPAMEAGNLWSWTIWLKGGPDHHIGSVELRDLNGDNRGFWLGLPWHGRGIMTEACEPVTDYWFNTLGRETLRVAKAPDNTASRRVTEKQGARVIAIEERSYVGGVCAAEIWELTREDWNALRAATRSV
ncbi:GNAT family N-acetyltransferase [Rhodomicrobium vannielii ATCC 17100]|uniref:GNAT family N-acetyltransferase n=1 Tax=Rhodomicrobium vannielii TaxID=1069 RepID=UPI001919D0B8|nr:GNAT family N-acetyltransferase [Rhodomicrobium vannielii]MBJ7535053.1 GNAT family N-acetyltransferase [Rhodomicrobium vannielii ATCC 17100]